MASEGALVVSSSYAVHWTLILHYSHALSVPEQYSSVYAQPPRNRVPLKSIWEVKNTVDVVPPHVGV